MTITVPKLFTEIDCYCSNRPILNLNIMRIQISEDKALSELRWTADCVSTITVPGQDYGMPLLVDPNQRMIITRCSFKESKTLRFHVILDWHVSLATVIDLDIVSVSMR